MILINLNSEIEFVRQSRALRDVAADQIDFWWARYQAYRDFGLSAREIAPAMDAELYRRETIRRQAFGDKP